MWSAEEPAVICAPCSVPITAEAMHIGSLIAAQGYFFPISDHVLSLKDDGTFYRFQVSKGAKRDTEMVTVAAFRINKSPFLFIKIQFKTETRCATKYAW